jgi:hypothetical protein
MQLLRWIMEIIAVTGNVVVRVVPIVFFGGRIQLDVFDLIFWPQNRSHGWLIQGQIGPLGHRERRRRLMRETGDFNLSTLDTDETVYGASLGQENCNPISLQTSSVENVQGLHGRPRGYFSYVSANDDLKAMGKTQRYHLTQEYSPSFWRLESFDIIVRENAVWGLQVV